MKNDNKIKKIENPGIVERLVHSEEHLSNIWFSLDTRAAPAGDSHSIRRR